MSEYIFMPREYLKDTDSVIKFMEKNHKKIEDKVVFIRKPKSSPIPIRQLTTFYELITDMEMGEIIMKAVEEACGK